jgi:hypothetical protein
MIRDFLMEAALPCILQDSQVSDHDYHALDIYVPMSVHESISLGLDFSPGSSFAKDVGRGRLGDYVANY